MDIFILNYEWHNQDIEDDYEMHGYASGLDVVGIYDSLEKAKEDVEKLEKLIAVNAYYGKIFIEKKSINKLLIESSYDTIYDGDIVYEKEYRSPNI